MAALIIPRLNRQKPCKPVSIIIHGLEYPRYTIEVTGKADPGGEADTFLKRAGGTFVTIWFIN